MTTTDPRQALDALWTDSGLPRAMLDAATLTGAEPALPSSFAVGTAAQVSFAAAALAALAIGQQRKAPRQTLSIDMRHAALESCAYFTLDGTAPPTWDKIAGLYACRSGQVRVHTNFAHHRDGLLRLLGLPGGADTDRASVAAALAERDAFEFEALATQAGLVVAALRDFEAWDAHPHATVVAAAPLVALERIGEAPVRAWPRLDDARGPLSGLRVLDFTRILAGPVGGRTLASFGADVMLVNSPHLPNIDAIADTSRGKLSAQADLRHPPDRDAVEALVRDAEVFIQGYRPGALGALGLGPERLARLSPGIVAVSLSAYGEEGPWANKRGFDSLVQAATGFNLEEARAASQASPRPLPMQILDMASGALMAFGAQAALWRQRHEGGSWHVRVSLARTALWLRKLGRVQRGFEAAPAGFDGYLELSQTGYGELRAVRPAARFSRTPALYRRPSMPPGTHPLAWPDR